MKIGDKIRVKENYNVLAGCEGYIIDIEGNYYVVDLYKGNGRVTERELAEFHVYLKEKYIEKITKLNVKQLRETKNTKIISTEESLKDIEAWFNDQMKGR